MSIEKLDNVHLLQVVHRYHNYISVIDYIEINATQLNMENL